MIILLLHIFHLYFIVFRINQKQKLLQLINKSNEGKIYKKKYFLAKIYKKREVIKEKFDAK